MILRLEEIIGLSQAYLHDKWPSNLFFDYFTHSKKNTSCLTTGINYSFRDNEKLSIFIPLIQISTFTYLSLSGSK